MNLIIMTQELRNLAIQAKPLLALLVAFEKTAKTTKQEIEEADKAGKDLAALRVKALKDLKVEPSEFLAAIESV